MDVLNKPIGGMTFEKVVEFCKEGHPEGVQVDYKRDFPSNGFAKHFAAFSNTRGGVIIIGVEEDKKSGVPLKWEGVVKDAKQIERIHQTAGNVEPVPSYDVHTTDEVEGKCFVLIRIYEGDNTPYYVQNDSNVWTRNGNVSSPNEIASPDGLELMFGKKEKADKARKICLKTAEDVYLGALKREDRKRKQLIEEAKRSGEEEKAKGYFQQNLGSNALICRMALLPYFPQKALVTPREIQSNLDAIRLRNRNYGTFPALTMEAIPQGLLYFSHGYDGYIESQQIYGQGLVFQHFDALNVSEDGKRTVHLWRIAGKLFILLKFAQNFYEKFDYQGSLKGFVSFEKMADVFIVQIKPSRRMFFDDDNQSFLDNYSVNIELDTNVLNSPEALKEYYFSLIKEIYWVFGYENAPDEDLEDFMKEGGIAF
jgi:hypothetical protein